ncbi:MAG: succinate--CoA ligase subunit beta [Candidatus Aenigmarchaeota archaeon]|nr:succinate--CoA ligase subunit beta [Candidatus Aenigmarchaeota archaeon]
MMLHEYEGKALLKKHGIAVPDGKVVRSPSGISDDPDRGKVMVKAQIYASDRAAKGGIIICKDPEDVKRNLSRLLGSKIGNETVHEILVEEKAEIKKELYLSITYDTDSRLPAIIFSSEGGSGIENRFSEGKQKIVKRNIDPLSGLQPWQAREIAIDSGTDPASINKIADVMLKAYRCFLQEDCRLIEINPLAETPTGFMAIDARIDLDETAGFRHPEVNYQRVAVDRQPTEREISVKKANDADYRGTVKYVELDGDIGFLAAGGGGSITCMDALLLHGAKPANYAEYSGNPSAQKVYELVKAAASKPGLKGLWIVGAVANFTRVDETMKGVIDALKEIKPNYPIVVRRSGPFEKEGLELLKKAAKEHGWRMEIYGKEMPLTRSAEIMVQRIKNIARRGD